MCVVAALPPNSSQGVHGFDCRRYLPGNGRRLLSVLSVAALEHLHRNRFQRLLNGAIHGRKLRILVEEHPSAAQSPGHPGK